jgi:hypothetical protein
MTRNANGDKGQPKRYGESDSATGGVVSLNPFRFVRHRIRLAHGVNFARGGKRRTSPNSDHTRTIWVSGIE